MESDRRETRLMADKPRRFFVERAVVEAGEVAIAGDLAHRLARVLRLRAGDEIVLAFGAASEARVRLDAVSASLVSGTIVGEQPAPIEPETEVVLYQALIRANRFDFAIEKGTEAGVSRFVPVICARTQGHGEEPSSRRTDRWRRLIAEAAEQCGRGKLPEISEPLTFAEALGTAPGVKILPWEDERERKLAAYLRSLSEQAPPAVSLFIGPEGGYTNEEIELAVEAGAALVTLGGRVMRSETAAVIACGIALHELD